jgi:hypothetical protein
VRGATLTSQLAVLASDQPSELVHCDLNQLLAEMEPVLRLALPPGKTLVVDLDRRPCMVVQDLARFQRALLMLAADAACAEDRFSFVTEICELAPEAVGDLPQGTYVRLSVGDSIGDAVTARATFVEADVERAAEDEVQGTRRAALQAARFAGGRLLMESSPGGRRCICFYLPLRDSTDNRAPVG